MSNSAGLFSVLTHGIMIPGLPSSVITWYIVFIYASAEV